MLVEDIIAAFNHFKVAIVQNRYNVGNRSSDDALEYCEQHGIGFIPWSPLAAGDLAKSGSLLKKLAKEHDASPSQLALAWMLKRSPVMLPTPGTSKVAHLEQNVAVARIELTDEQFSALDAAGKSES